MNAQELLHVLQHRTSFQVVDHSAAPKQLRIMGRVLPPMDSWWIVLDRIFEAEKAGTVWSVDISKLYYKPTPEIRFTWRIILQAPDNVSQYFQTIADLINSAPKAQAVPVDEMPLMGASADRNESRNGRGAQGVLRPVLAATTRR
jgi:hypothetical protein